MHHSAGRASLHNEISTGKPKAAAMNKPAITVWKDGTWCLWTAGDAVIAENDPEWLLTIPLDSEGHPLPSPPKDPAHD